MEDNILFAAKGICKTFGETKALSNVDIEVKKGEIHGIIGENGSGKSTLSSIIAGVRKADKGQMFFRGNTYNPESVIDASKKGISMIVQEQNTINMITVAANIFMADEEQFVHCGYLNINKMNSEARKVLDSVEAYNIPAEVQIEKLSFEDRKLVELGRAMYVKPGILIIDETTTALTIKGREKLYSIMKKLRNEGGSVLFISHNMDEIMELSDSITILKDGCVTANLSKEEFDASEIKQLMVGRDIADHFYRADFKPQYDEKVLLEVKNLSQGILKNISFDLHRGEILGVGGLTECGMHDLGKILFGLIKPDTGSIVKESVKISDTETAIKNGIGYVSKNRDTEVLMPICSIKNNICIVSLKELTKHGLITKKREKSFADKWVKKLNIKAYSIEQFCSALSGGNKQKVALAKWLGKDSEVLILDCPTRGIDIGVKAAIYELLNELKKEGKAILMISEELPETIGMSDRVLILKDGQITKEFVRSETLSEGKLIEYMI